MKRLGQVLIVLVLVGVAGYFGIDLAPQQSAPASAPAGQTARAGGRLSVDSGAEQVAAAARDRRSGFMVTVPGEVIKSLPDDNDGSRHQRFLIKLANRQTLLVAHNIDLAPRVPLTEGEVVEIHGQYEWNDRGGVLHWTHHDPKQWREGGWIVHRGKKYE